MSVCPKKSALKTTGAGHVTHFKRSHEKHFLPWLRGWSEKSGFSPLSAPRCVCSELRAARPAQPAQPSPAAVVGAAHGVAAVCVCVAAAPAAQGLVPTQLCLQSSLFLQEAAHLPLPPPLGSCERLSSFPLTPFQGSPGVSPFPGLLTQSDQKSPLLFAAPLVLCSFLSLLFPPPHLRSRLQPWPHLRTPRPVHLLLS